MSLHASDPQFLPEANLRFPLAAALVASVYLGDAFSFALYGMASQPELQSRIQEEADALFGAGDPDERAFNLQAMDVTHRFLLECLRIWPIVPMSLRDVVNPFDMEGYQLKVGTRVYIAQTASHYMSDVFPDPYTFDIDRYLPPRNEHQSPGYAPYGLGTHKCLGSRWLNLQFGGQCAHGGASLHVEGGAGELQAPVQPDPVDEAEQEAQVPDRRAEARVAGLNPPISLAEPGLDHRRIRRSTFEACLRRVSPVPIRAAGTRSR